MNNGYSTRSNAIAAAVAAFAVSASLLSTLVGSFEPAQLQRIEEKSADEQVAAVDQRRRQLDKAIKRNA